MRHFIVFLALFICKLDPTRVQASVDKVQPNIFILLMQQVRAWGGGGRGRGGARDRGTLAHPPAQGKRERGEGGRTPVVCACVCVPSPSSACWPGPLTLRPPPPLGCQVWLPNMPMIEGLDEEKLLAVATTKCLCEFPAMRQHQDLWASLKDAVTKKLQGGGGGRGG